MPTHAEQRTLSYTPEQMFALVADIEKYPEFLPWCADCTITGREGDTIIADLSVGFMMFRETFTSRVKPDRAAMRIDVEYLDGPFKYLTNHWTFRPAERGNCLVDFFIDFEFKAGLMQKAMETFFNEAVKMMIRAFEDRARKVYG